MINYTILIAAVRRRFMARATANVLRQATALALLCSIGACVHPAKAVDAVSTPFGRLRRVPASELEGLVSGHTIRMDVDRVTVPVITSGMTWIFHPGGRLSVRYEWSTKAGYWQLEGDKLCFFEDLDPPACVYLFRSQAGSLYMLPAAAAPSKVQPILVD